MDIKGIDINGDRFKENLNLNLKFYYSDLKFYENSKALTGCDRLDHSTSLFRNVSFLTFSFSVKYHLNTCALIFQNTNLLRLEFYGISQVFVKNNILGFLDNNKSNAKIEILYFSLYRATLNKKLIGKYLFSSVKELSIIGDFIQIDANVLNKLPSLRTVTFSLKSSDFS